jgi:predicted metal-dependent hydrolase
MTPAPPVFIEQNGFIVEVIRTQCKKSATIKVEEGAVTVIVPRALPLERIEQLVLDKYRWIKGKLYIQSQVQPVAVKEFVNGEVFSYLARNYRLKINHGSYQPAKLIKGQLVVTVPQDAENSNIIRNAIIRWYRARALERLKEKSNRYATIIGQTPKSVDIKTFKARWGSCSTNGKVLFNWKIMMAPNRIVDYVVVHELCHLLHHNHSPLFWKSVERVMPDYAECKEWLKLNGAGLEL